MINKINFLLQLSIRKRMSLILLAFIVPIGGLCLSLYVNARDAINFSETELRGARYQMPISQLLNEIADYQVAEIMAKQGDADAQGELQEGRKTIDGLFDEFAFLDVELGRNMHTTAV